VWGRAPSPVQAERSSAAACGHRNSRFVLIARATVGITLRKRMKTR